MHKVGLVVIVLAAVCSPLVADWPGSAVTPEMIKPLLRAADVEALDRAFRAITPTNPAVEAVYHRKRLELRHTAAGEVEFLRTLPRSEQELNAVYQLSDMRDLCEDPLVSSTVYDMFQTSANLAMRHGAFHRRVLQLCLWSIAETGEVAWPECDSLLTEDPNLTTRALRSLPMKERLEICGGHDPRELNTREVLRQCQSGL
jgi:hypothetical protein